MSEPPIARPIGNPEEIVDDDVHCVICGYSLRSLKLNGRCPECGSPINRSIQGNLLRYAEVDWLKKVILGIRLMLWSIPIWVVLQFLVLNGRKLGEIILPADGCSVALAALDLLAAFLITTQEPRISVSESRVTWRRVVRACACTALAGEVLQPVGTTAAGLGQLTTVGIILGQASVVAFFGKFAYLRGFAQRMPRPRLGCSTRVVMWGLGVFKLSVAILWLSFVIVTLVIPPPAGSTTWTANISVQTSTGPAITTQWPGRPAGPAGGAVTLVAALITLDFLVFAVWYVCLLFAYRNAFYDALAYARRLSQGPALSNLPVGGSA